MTNEERDLISAFIQRVGGQPAPSGFAGSVPPTAPPLPPVEPQADAFIAEQFARFPEARYRITQMAFVQEHALVEAQNQINRLQWELTQAQQAAQQAPPMAAPQAPSPWGAAAAPMGAPPPPQPPRGILGGMFGRQTPPAYPPQGYPQQGYPQQPPPQYAPPPPPQYAPGYQPGMFQRGGGSGFLGSALTTAAGVAGGMVAGNALMNMFSHHNTGGGGMFGSGAGGLASNTASPWASPPPAAADPYAIGGAPKDTGWTDAPAAGQQDPWSSPTSDPTPADSGWSSPASDPSGGQDAGWSDPDPGTDDGGGGDAGGWSDTEQV